MKKYLFSYPFGGKKWSIEIFADSEQEAREKLRAAANASYDGEIMQQVYVPIKTGWLARILGRLKDSGGI